MFVVKYLLWLQTGYAIWQFFRYTKFLRLPYVVLSSMWNSGIARSWFQKRKFLWVEGEPEFNTRRTRCRKDEEKIKDKYAYSYEAETRWTFFRIGKEAYTYLLYGVRTDQLSSLLSHQEDYHIGYKLLPIYKDVFILKCLPLQKALEKVAEGAKVHVKEEYCLLDETTEEYLNENFLRIMSILPLSLQARGFDSLSTYLSAALLALDLFSVPANEAWQRFCDMFIRYTKLTLAHFPVRIRVPVHYVLSTGSEEFMFRDMYRKKTYWSKPGDFLVEVGNRVDGWVLKDSLLTGRKEFTENNKMGTFTIASQQVQYEILQEDSTYELKFGLGEWKWNLRIYSTETVNNVLYKISVINNMPTPPIHKLKGRTIYFTSIENYLKGIDTDGYSLYTSSPEGMLYCS